MFKVTYKSIYKVKSGRKWAEKSSQWEETIKDESSAKLRALALNWHIVSIKPASNN